jgi:hypothetical protein
MTGQAERARQRCQSVGLVVHNQQIGLLRQ